MSSPPTSMETGSPDIALVTGASTSVGVLMNTGSGTFGALTTYGNSVGANGIVAVDFNGDGAPGYSRLAANTTVGTVELF